MVTPGRIAGFKTELEAGEVSAGDGLARAYRKGNYCTAWCSRTRIYGTRTQEEMYPAYKSMREQKLDGANRYALRLRGELTNRSTRSWR